MMARMTPVSLHFSDVPTGWEKKIFYRQTTVGYWFCMFVTNSLSRRTLLQINLRQLHSVPCATRYASLPAPTSFYTTDGFTHRRFYTQMRFTHAHTLSHTFHTQTLLHTDALTHKRFYTQTLLHTDAFTHRRFYTQKLLHTDGFTHRRFYTQMRFTHAHTLSHTNTFTHRRVDTQFAFFSSVFDVQRPFRA